jgi:acyl-CoA dehydrogenase
MEIWQSTQGFFFELPIWLTVVAIAGVTLGLGFTGAPLWLWAVAGFGALWGFSAPVWLWGVFGGLVLLFNVRPIRRTLISKPLMGVMEKLGVLPSITETQRVAIESGTVWVEGEFFSGRPDFDRILEEPYPELTDEEQAFLDGPIEELCEMVDDWDVHVEKDLPDEAWEFIRDNKIWGMIIPEEYGGLGFSTAAHSAVIQKLASRSLPLAVTVMVPNSLGPAELLLEYGTDAQKDHYLPRLASGAEVPCFGLTEPTAGSDATAVASTGVLFEDDGELKIRLNWSKRYITLSAVSTVLGLAFRLEDPEGLLGDEEDLGITCALVPSDAEGAEFGRRHEPLGVPFVNGPTEGEDVVIGADQIIGGLDQAGEGWKMLSEALAEGRGISLPAQSEGSAKLASRVVGSYASVRQQFGLPVARFGGVEEKLADIAGRTYLMDALRTFTTGALDSGAKPGVVSAIAKYNATEINRDLIDDAMDVLGGAGIIMGPKNTLATTYWGQPIGITVEGANILTRTLMIFGQGVIRCHPYAYDEIRALEQGDVEQFDDKLFSHLGFVVRNFFRATMLSATRGWLAGSPVSGKPARYYRKLAWASATFAFLTDLAMGSLGGQLQRKEKLTGRFADVLSWMFIGTSVLRRYEAEGRPDEDWPFVEWSMKRAFSHIQDGFEALAQNLPVPGLGWLMEGPVSWWMRLNRFDSAPSDELGSKIAEAITELGERRERLTAGAYVPDGEDERLAVIEEAHRVSEQAAEVYAEIRHLQGDELPEEAKPKQLVELAYEKGIIDEQKRDLLEREQELRRQVVAVDAFPVDELAAQVPTPGARDAA